jgi:hypothetical protein
MKILLSGLAMSTLAITSAAAAAPHLLPQGSLICDSPALYERQIDLIVAKSHQLVPGCGLSKSAMIVELVKTSLLGASEVFVPSANVTIYVDGSAIK